MLSISIDNLNQPFTVDALKEELNALARHEPFASLSDRLIYTDRGDEGVQIKLEGARGLLEVGLDDDRLLHMHCSFIGELELLGLALHIVDNFSVKYSGIFEKDEVRYLKYLHHLVKTNAINWECLDV